MVKCIGKNFEDYLRVCACFMRQIKGCDDIKMKSGRDVSINFLRIIQKMDWDKTTICSGFNEGSEDERICCCLGGQKSESCDPKMRIVPMTKAAAEDCIKNLNC